MLTHPVTLYWHRADQLCVVVPPSSWVPCKKRPLPFFNVFGMTGPSSNRESNPQILLVSAGSPLSSPFTISRGYWGPIRYQGAPLEAPTPDPQGRAPTGNWTHRTTWSLLSFPYRSLLRSAEATEGLFVTRQLHQEPPPEPPWDECWRFYAVPTSRVIFTVKISFDIFSLSQEQGWTFSVLGDQIYEMRCSFVAVGPNAHFIGLPHWDNMS